MKVNGTGKITMRNRVSLRKIPQPILIQLPLNLPRHLQVPGVPCELGADVTAATRGHPGGWGQAGGCDWGGYQDRDRSGT